MKQKKKKMQSKDGVRLFLITLPLLIAVFVFSYLPLSGWSYAFFDYKAGYRLLDCNFVGFKHFTSLFANPVRRSEMLRVLKNTFAMSLLGIAGSVLPLTFAILLSEIRNKKYRRVVQTVTTIPNFISWVLVYSIAYAMFSIDGGFVNNLLNALEPTRQSVNYLASGKNVWITMWLYGLWKSLGWSSIMYIASLSSIDEQLYEAADIDGAGRFRKIWHITIPGLLPTFFVLLMLSIASFLNNGMDQYFVFQNPMNKENIEVLDLFVYNIGMTGNNISFSTAIGMLKSLVSVVLLFSANGISKLVRGESII